VLISLTLLVFLTLSATVTYTNPATPVSSSSVQNVNSTYTGELYRAPEEVYSWQAVLIFAHISPPYAGEVKLDVSVTIKAALDSHEWSFPPHSYTMRMIPVAWAPGWYVAAIPGLPAETRKLEGIRRTYTFTISSSVGYSLIVDDKVLAHGEYEVLEGNITKHLPPLVLAVVRDVLQEPLLVNETLGLGPSGWVQASGNPLKVLIIAVDDAGVEGIESVTFEYRVGEQNWNQLNVSEDPLMQSETELVDDVNQFIEQVENKVKEIRPEFELRNVKLPALIANAEIPGQDAGVYVMFRANATDVDGNNSTSPMGFYYVVNEESSVRVLIVDPHVKLWLLDQNLELLAKHAKESSEYQVPADIKGNMTLLNKTAYMIDKYSIEPFHHWEYIGKYYNLYIAWPDNGITNLLKNQTDGGFEPHVIVLSSLTLGFNGTKEIGPWNWDLRDLGVLDDVISYVKERHAGLIVTHGTLSDWVVWLGSTPEEHYKVGTRGHVGESIADVNVLNEKTVAAILGMPGLAIWEFVRDKIAYILCSDPATESVGLLIGSLPLQVPYVPFNGSMGTTPEAADIGWTIPSEFNVTIPSLYNEFNVSAYTQVGWQLALQVELAYRAWYQANETRGLAEVLYSKLSQLLENVTQAVYPAENFTQDMCSSLEWGLKQFYRSIVSANISGTTLNITVYVPRLGKNITITVDIEEAYNQLLQLLPVKLVAVSSDRLAAIIAYDKYWDSNGYRSVYFSFEVEAAEGEVSELLLTQAINWTMQWEYKNVTELLGGLVRVHEDLAARFRDAVNKAPGTEVLSEGLITVEEGYSVVDIDALEPCLYHLIIVHPTAAKVNVTVLEGDAEVSYVNVTDGLTEVTINVYAAGCVRLGVKADPQSSLNPAYMTVKQESDEEAPTVCIITPAENAVVGGTVPIRVNATDAGIGVANVTFYIDGKTVFVDTEAPYEYHWDTTGVDDGSHEIKVVVVDYAGNKNIALRSVVVDNTKPSAEIKSPSEGAYVSGTSKITVDFSDANLETAELYIDGTLVCSWTELGQYSYAWNTTETMDGEHEIRLVVRDKAGNVAEDAITVIVDNTAPVAEIVEPSAGAFLRGTVGVVVKGEDANLELIELYIAGELVASWSEAGTHTYEWDTTTLTDGSYSIRLVVKDKAGNTVERTLDVTVDNTPPVVGSPALSPEEPKAGEDVTVSVEVSDATAGVEKVLLWYRVSGGSWTSVEMKLEGGVWKATIPGQAAGAIVEYYVEAYDKAGNVAKSATASYTVGRRPTAGFMAIAGAIIAVAVIAILLVVLKKRT